MELPRKKKINIHIKRLIYFSGIHISTLSLKEKKTWGLFCCCLYSDDNGDAISSVNSDVSEGEAQTGESDNMQLMEESPYLFFVF